MIEIGHCTVYGNNCFEYHIVHYLLSQEIKINLEGAVKPIEDENIAALQFIKSIFDRNNAAVNDAFIRHFGVNGLELTFMDESAHWRLSKTVTILPITQTCGNDGDGDDDGIEMTDKQLSVNK